jgi:DNA repair exonuclease SbcCD nuclease subunit
MASAPQDPKPGKKILVWSDLHLSPKNYVQCINYLRSIHEIALHNDCDYTINCGDFYDVIHSTGALPIAVLNELLRFFHVEWKVPTFMIVGNHDFSNRAETINGLTSFSMVNPLIQVISEPTPFPSMEIALLPFCRNVDKLRAQILQFAPDAKTIFAHMDTIGATVNTNRKSEEARTANSSWAATLPRDDCHLARGWE